MSAIKFKVRPNNIAPTTLEGGGGSGKLHDTMMYFLDRSINITFCTERIKYKTDKQDIDFENKFRILPAFDFSLDPVDKAFPTSSIPFMDVDSGTIDPDLHCPSFTNWAVPIKIHKQVFRSKKSFISPLTLTELWGQDIEGIYDPIVDIMIYLSKCDNESWKHLKDIKARPDDKFSPPIITNTREEALINVVQCKEDGTLGDRTSVMNMAKLAFKQLKRSITIPTGGEEAEISDGPLQERYVYGDPTDLEYGLIAKVISMQEGQSRFKLPCFDHSKRPTKNSKPELAPCPLDLNNPVHKKLLEDRVNFYDIENKMKIMSYEDIVELIKAEGQVPQELLQNACGHRCDVGSASPSQKNAVYSTAPSAPVAPAAPVAPVVPSPVPGGKNYWVAKGPGQAPVLMSEGDVDGFLFDNGTEGVMCMTEDQSSGWKSPEDLGLSKSKPAAPAAPVAPAAPTAPSPVSETPTPQASTPEVTGGTDAEKTRYEELNKMMEAGTLTQDLIGEFVNLSSKFA